MTEPLTDRNVPGDTARPAAGALTAPLRTVQKITVSTESGKALNPNYFWLTWEYSLELDCGHVQVRARCAYDFDPAPEKLTPALPARVRCSKCAAVPVQRRRPPTRRKPDPQFDPLVGHLVAAMRTAVPDREDDLLDWVTRFGRWVPDEARRARGYAAMSMVAIDAYLPDTRNRRAAAVRAAVATWSAEPSRDNRVAVSRAARRLYDSQERDGDWFAHRGVIDAAKIVSPAPHNIRGVLACPTWDAATRNTHYGRMWELRNGHDAARAEETAAFLDDDGDAVRRHNDTAQALAAELTAAVESGGPMFGEQHIPLADAMLAAYQAAVHVDQDQGWADEHGQHGDAHRAERHT